MYFFSKLLNYQNKYKELVFIDKNEKKFIEENLKKFKKYNHTIIIQTFKDYFF